MRSRSRKRLLFALAGSFVAILVFIAFMTFVVNSHVFDPKDPMADVHLDE